MPNPNPNKKVESNRAKTQFASLSYPSEGATHGIVMSFFDYSYRSGSTANVTPSGSLAFPLPQQIADMINVNIKASELGIIGAGIADLASNSGNNPIQEALKAAAAGGAGLAEFFKDTLSGDFSGTTGAISNASSAALFAARAGLTSLSPNIGDALSVTSGTAVNPHATLVFDGVQLKKFNFTWQFAPRSNAESAELHKIINTVRKNILPSYDSNTGGGGSSFSRSILKYPKMVDFAFVGLDPSRSFRFKRSMIDSFSVDYSPQGNAMNKGSGSGSDPAFVNITMGFTEAEIWTSEDYE